MYPRFVRKLQGAASPRWVGLYNPLVPEYTISTLCAKRRDVGMAPRGADIRPGEGALEPQGTRAYPIPFAQPGVERWWSSGARYPAPATGLCAPGVPSVSILGRESWAPETRQQGTTGRARKRGPWRQEGAGPAKGKNAPTWTTHLPERSSKRLLSMRHP